MGMFFEKTLDCHRFGKELPSFLKVHNSFTGKLVDGKGKKNG